MTSPAASGVTTPPLRLLSRRDCCLCQGLEERLRALEPPLALEVVDVDGDPALHARYDLSVPVLAVAGEEGWRDLPRVPPRLAGGGLLRWLRRHGAA